MSSYSLSRSFFYGFTWVFSLILLGLTGYRLHHTKSGPNGSYDPVVAELLVTSILALLWIPVSIAMLLRRASSELTSSGLSLESAGLFVLWVMYLIGGAIATHKWPSKAVCGTGKQCDVLLTIVAFSWIDFGFITIVFTLILMEHAATSAASLTGRYTSEKPPVTA